jgi:hypothetical protein
MAKRLSQRSTTERGYGPEHQKLRARWAPQVALGEVRCARCRRLIKPNEPWDLDHSEDRSKYLGPSHARCNRATATHAAQRRQAAPARRSLREW